MNIDEFVYKVRELGGIWGDLDIYFSDNELKACYMPSYPVERLGDAVIIGDSETGELRFFTYNGKLELVEKNISGAVSYGTEELNFDEEIGIWQGFFMQFYEYNIRNCLEAFEKQGYSSGADVRQANYEWLKFLMEDCLDFSFDEICLMVPRASMLRTGYEKWREALEKESELERV